MNKKKWGGNSKIFSTIILVFVVCCFMAASSWAARKVDFYSANAGSFIEKLNQDESTESESIGPLLGLSQDGAFTLLRKKTDFNGVTHYRYQQTYKGFPVWGIQTIISRGPANQVVRLHGAMVLDIPKDIKKIPSSLDPLGALNKMEDQHKKIDENAQWTFRNEKYGTYIYLHKNKKAHLCYVVSFFADTDCGNPSRPVFFIDAKNGKIIDSFDSLAYAYDGTGSGGNPKVGYYYYGTDYPKFGVAVADSVCTMNWADCKTVDLNHGTSGSTAYSYTCYENTHEAINGAYCPLNDAQYFGQVVFDTYMDWYSVPVLPFQLTLRCHYSTNYEDYFWDGSTMTFGDGYTTFYPLVALDVTAHEASHGFTEYNSGLIYENNQWGGINESFSDMAGEAAKYYVRGTNDFRFAFDIFKDPDGALRYLYDPPLDGQSIDHVDDYYDGMAPHRSSGIFNKAFYLIATSPGWTTQMAFDIFVKANQDYWIPCINFQQGAEGALDAAEDYGYSYQDVVNAFAQVGITLTYPGSYEYCPSSGVSQYYEYIAGVEVGDLNNPSGSSPYSNFTHLVANLTQGETVNVELTPGFTGSAYYECWKIWIDYNGDHDFDEGEQVFSGSGNDVVTGSFIVPNCTVCCTRMRVSMSYSGSGCPTSCGTFQYGEVEDYAVDINGTHKPVARFTADNTIISQGQSVQFFDNSFYNPTGWSWAFEGGTPSVSGLENPVVTYYTAGIYDVILTAANACGSDTGPKLDYITVNPCLPQVDADFVTGVTNIRVGDCINFTDQSTGSPTSWDWTFEGGTPATSTDRNPTCITYNTAGTYTVSLTVTNACGGDTETKPGYINVSDTAYCASWGITHELYYINDVKVANLNNPSGDDDGYGDFTGMPAANLTQGKTYSVSLKSSILYNFYWKIWIDYNGDYDFDDAGEEVFSSYGEGSITGSISVPCNTIIGDTRMRVTMADDDESLPPCVHDAYGEVEDYTVNISPNTDLDYKVGNTTVFGSNSFNSYRYAQPVTMPETGTIKSVSMYHNGGSGQMILGVYGGEGSPHNRMAVTPATLVSTSAGWQTIDLPIPWPVTGGSTIWLAWVYQSNPGVKRESSSQGGAYQSPYVWVGGMPDPFGASTQTDYIYSIYATYTTPACTVGYSDEFEEVDTNDIRRAQPFTMPEDGTIESISMYHEAGTGINHMILAVYDGEDFPHNRIAVTPTDPDDPVDPAPLVSTSAGWQNIALTNPVFVKGGTHIWLAWVYEQIAEATTGIRYEIGIPEVPGAVDSDSGWPSPLPPLFDPMPDIFRCSFKTDPNRNYSIYAKYTPGGGGGEPTYKTLGSNEVYPYTDDVANRQAMPFTMPETGTIKSVTMYHNGGGSGDMILAVYDGASTPTNLLAVTASTAVCSSEGWQTIELTSPEEVTGGTKIWLAWVYESNPGIRKINGLPGGAYLSADTWPGGMPDPFGSGTQTSISYSIFATYTVD